MTGRKKVSAKHEVPKGQSLFWTEIGFSTQGILRSAFKSCVRTHFPFVVETHNQHPNIVPCIPRIPACCLGDRVSQRRSLMTQNTPLGWVNLRKLYKHCTIRASFTKPNRTLPMPGQAYNWCIIIVGRGRPFSLAFSHSEPKLICFFARHFLDCISSQEGEKEKSVWLQASKQTA